LINSFLTAPDKQKNEYCWIDPPLLFGGGAGVPKGLNLGTFDLLFESFMAASRADILSNCPFHPYFQKQYKASPNYLRAKIGDAISVLDSKVGMSVGYQLADELDKQRDAVKKEGNLSPHIDAWYYFAKAKAEYYKEEDKKADEFLKKALAKGGYEAFFHNLQGLLQVRAKKYDDAVTTFKKAYKMEPKLLQLYIESIEALLVVRDDDGKFTLKKQVEDLLGELKKVFGDHTDYLYLKGKLAAATGDDKDAEKLWTKALDSQKAPYYGDHYDANIAMGKLWMVRAKKYDRERKYKKSDYSELVAAFKVSDKKIRKNIKRDTQEKFLKKAYEQYDKFLAALKDEKRIPKKVMLLYTGSLREAIYEEAGAYFQTAMSSRPGSVESRMQTGLIYLNSKSWNDCVGHFTVAAVGHLRDLNYKGAKKAYTYLATALINGVDDKPRKKRKEKAEKVEQRFKFLATAELRKAYLKVATATDKKKKKDKKLSDSKKKHLLSTLDDLASVVEGTKLPKPAKELAETIREDIKVVKDKGIMTWFKVFKQRMQNKGKKGKRRRRRRR
jgi:tetratricopeptide (TPR) repeat protein